jgi:hypothetical protein
VSLTPVYDSWYAEKSARLIEALLEAAAAHRFIEDATVRRFIGGKLRVALEQAENVINSRFYETPADYPPHRAGGFVENPDAGLAWLNELRARSSTEKSRTREPDQIVGAVRRNLEQLAMENGTTLTLPEN